MNQVTQKITKARTALILEQPFFGMLAMRLHLVATDRVPTLAVDGKTIFYNEEFVNGLTHELTKSAIGHEVMHCVLDHMYRRQGREPRRWNQAGDYVINPMLEDAGLELGKGWLYNPAFAGKTTDEVYNLLPESNEDDKSNDPLDQVEDGDANQADGSMTSTDWKIAAVQAATEANKIGKLPGSLQRFVEKLTEPQVDWREVLRSFITERARDDYSWMRPNRRLAGQGIFMPGLYSEAMGEIAVVIDTSGSITDKTLAKFGTEIQGIVDNTRPSKVHVIYCDAEVNHADTFGLGEPLKFEGHGGGGTDFRPPFKYIEENQITPICLVYLTDLYGPHGDAPEYPVMWCCTSDEVAPWGMTLKIEA